MSSEQILSMVFGAVPSIRGTVQPTETPEVPSPRKLRWGVMTPVLDASNTIIGFTFVTNSGKTGTMPNEKVTLEESFAEYAKGVE